jgi:predicted CXXCH cytochrome family protein
MRWRLTIACGSVVALFGAQPEARGQQNPYRLIEPNQTKACLACHTDFEPKLKKLFVHTAVKSGDCSGCHDPHVSSHPKLLSAESREICATKSSPMGTVGSATTLMRPTTAASW